MDSNNELLKEFVHDLFTNYKEYVKERLQKSMKGKKISDSELEASLQTVLSGSDLNEVVSVIFADYGRIIDQKRKFQNPPPPLAELEAWIRKKGGLSKFKIPDYENAKRVPTQNAAIRRIALGISYGMKIKVSRRAWYFKAMYKSVGWLIGALASGISRNASKEITKTLKSE